MKQMGITPQPIDAEEVIIKTAKKEIVIGDPDVVKINMMGQEQFQISGTVSERQRIVFSDEDVAMVVDKTGATEEEARETLTATNGDLAESILRLKKK